MKSIIRIATATALTLTVSLPANTQASEAGAFNESVEATIGFIVREEIDAAISKTADLVREASEAVEREASEFDGKEKQLLEIVSSGADSMLQQTPEAIEKAWHEGSALAEKGVSLEDFDHFSKAMAFYDMILHPATAHALLKAYKQNGNRSLLEQAREELGELLEQNDMEETEEGNGGGH